jgi:hypothetical protein
VIARPPVWVVELAARFWAAVGDPPPFPRDLRTTIPWLAALRFREIPNLSLHRAAEPFRRWGIPFPTPEADRPLSGCFGGYGDAALILINATDTEDEKRLTCAHELAHYLRDFAEPRRKAAACLGSGILDVFDGRRTPTVEERLAGVLRGLAVGCQTQFLDRDQWCRVIGEVASESEEAADRLAFELIAPFNAVNLNASSSRARLAGHLTSAFGLPNLPASKYAAILLR